jgi:signal transduction histidine kinase
MGTLIQNLLALARNRDAVDREEPVDVAAAATAAWNHVETGAATLDVGTDLTVEADRSRLQQLFENLFGNAIEHGGEEVTVTVDDLPDGRGFYVADDGPGIPADDRDRLFEFGYSTAPEGTGIGLFVVAEIARAHGWEVVATDRDGGGARIEISGRVPEDTPGTAG